jgi:methylenetetrahydrofolate reductase (NADH)
MAGVLARVLGRRDALDGRGRAALAGALADPTWEIIPLKSADSQADALPPGATVAVTSSPAKGMAATLALALRLHERGFRVVPHLSARLVRDQAELLAFLDPLRDAGIDRLFVVGGDPEEPGPYVDALTILRAMADLGRLPAEVGIGCYPQGHPLISDDKLLAALAAKAPFATYMTSQLCFDSRAIETWLAGRRAEGLTLPVKIGIPGVAEIPKLVSISARIGVRDASRFILKNRRFVGQLLKSGGIYRPTGLLEDLAPVIADPAANVLGLHVYTFNNIPATVEWRNDELVTTTA